MNDVPVAAAADVVLIEDSDATRLDVLANDTDIDGDTLRVSHILGQPTNGRVVLADNGAIDYAPTPGFTGTDRLSYSVADSEGLGCGTARVTSRAEAAPALAESEALAVSEMLSSDDIGFGGSDAAQAARFATSAGASSELSSLASTATTSF